VAKDEKGDVTLSLTILLPKRAFCDGLSPFGALFFPRVLALNPKDKRIS